MAYTPFNASKPVITDTRATVVSDAKNNLVALMHMVLIGGSGALNWAYSISAGTNDKPTTLLASNGTQRIRWEITWSGHSITAITASYSSNSGSSYDTIASHTFNWTSGDITGGNTGGFLLPLILKALYEARVAQDTADAAGGGGSSYNPAAVAITGGTMTGVTINNGSVGLTTAAQGRFTRVYEGRTSYSPALNAGVTVNWSVAGGSFITHNGTNAITFSNVPIDGHLATHFILVSNLNQLTFPGGTTGGPGGTNPWGPSGKPSIAGVCAVMATTIDGGATYMYGIYWRGV